MAKCKLEELIDASEAVLFPST